MNLAAAALGAIVGLPSGSLVILLILETRRRGSTVRVVLLAGQLLALPTLWFGGIWVGRILSPGFFGSEQAISSYLAGLAVTFGLVVAAPVLSLARSVTTLMAGGTEDSDSRQRP